LNVSAILSTGISRILKIGSPRIISTDHLSRRRALPVRHVLPRAPLTKPSPHTTEHAGSLPPTTPTYASRAQSATASPPYHSRLGAASPRTDPTPTQAGASRSSGASIPPTGESGALGPVKSPNG
jgi:hypothetical protein